MIAITGATGQLGHLVVAALLKSVPAGEIVAIARNPEKAADLAAKGVVVRQGDYEAPESLVAAFAGVDKLLLISSNEMGKRAAQHAAVIEAAKKAGVGFIAYTSLLRAATSPMLLADEHKATEAALKASGIPHALLRNSWYIENYTMSLGAALAHGVVIGASRDGRVSAATRADYAEAAAAVLTAKENQAGKIYELGGDTAFTLAEYAAEIARQSGKAVAYNDLGEEGYKQALVGFGLPEGYAAVLANSDITAADGALFDDSRTLSRLIGRPTTPLATAIKAALPA
jgi:NAD(P)H dehydrogenase (quinone)